MKFLNSRNAKQSITFLLLVLTLGCGREEERVAEPPGQVVELTAEDWRQVRFYKEFAKPYLVWLIKANALKSTHYPTQGHPPRIPSPEDLEQAVYCLHQAVAAYPKKLPKEVPEEDRAKHRPVFQDAILSKGHVYLLMKNPELALHFYKKWKEITHNNVVDREIGEAEAMLAQKG